MSRFKHAARMMVVHFPRAWAALVVLTGAMAWADAASPTGTWGNLSPPPPPSKVSDKAALHQWVGRFLDGSNSAARMSATSANRKSFRMSWSNGQGILTVTTSKAGPVPKVPGTYSATKPEGEFDVLPLMTPDNLAAFSAWMTSNQVPVKMGYYVFKGPVRTDSYHEFYEIILPGNRDLAMETLARMLEALDPLEYPIDLR